MEIHGLNKTTLLDFPGRLSATIFTGGCNFRCPFCHNKDLVLNPSSVPTISQNDVYAFLEKRKTILSGVCITGGEPTLQRDLMEFLKPIKAMGYQIKLDTNGTNPKILQKLFECSCIDYVAMDIKSSPVNYHKAIGLNYLDFEKIEESAKFLLQGLLPYEFRTTVVKELHTKDDFLAIGNWITNAQAYYLQNFQDSEQVITSGFHSYSKIELNSFVDLLKPFIPSVSLRGVE